jgi:hypothetical protein
MHPWILKSVTVMQPVILPLFNWIGHICINVEMDVEHILLKRQDPDKN